MTFMFVYQMPGYNPSYIGLFTFITFLLGLCLLNGRRKHNRVPYFRSGWLTIGIVVSLIFIWSWTGNFFVDIFSMFPLRNRVAIVFIVQSIISLPFVFVSLRIAWGLSKDNTE
jgi:hypothetical protein